MNTRTHTCMCSSLSSLLSYFPISFLVLFFHSWFLLLSPDNLTTNITKTCAHSPLSDHSRVIAEGTKVLRDGNFTIRQAIGAVQQGQGEERAGEGRTRLGNRKKSDEREEGKGGRMCREEKTKDGRKNKRSELKKTCEEKRQEKKKDQRRKQTGEGEN